MNENIEIVKAQLAFLDELVEERNQLLDSLNASMKAVEGYAVGVRELSTSNENIFSQHKNSVLDLLAQQKISHESYHVFDSVLTSFYLTNKNAAIEAEKLLLSRQCEVAVIAKEIEKISQKRQQLVQTIEELNVKIAIEKRRENGVRPDQDLNTQAGRAAIDLVARKNAKKK
jgi:hypothetical protein